MTLNDPKPQENTTNARESFQTNKVASKEATNAGTETWDRFFSTKVGDNAECDPEYSDDGDNYDNIALRIQKKWGESAWYWGSIRTATNLAEILDFVAKHFCPKVMLNQ